MPTLKEHELESMEIELLLEAIFRRSGYDFREYASGSLRRRIRHAMREEGLDTVSALQNKLLHDPACLERFLLVMSIDVTGMFRDPAFFLALREKAAPLLRSRPFPRLWDAGCSSGEEVYSLAILLREEGLHETCRVYATDMNEAVLDRAQAGVFPLARMQEYSANYLRAGGKASFAEYYTARYDHAIFHAPLRENVLFAQHNLTTDGSFNEFQVILCRNVMIYFNQALQARVHRLLYDSLAAGGILGLGSKEMLRFSPHEADYEELDAAAKLYRKVR